MNFLAHLIEAAAVGKCQKPHSKYQRLCVNSRAMRPHAIPPSNDLAAAQMGSDAATIRQDFLDKLLRQQARFPAVATLNDHYLALAYVVRDRLLTRWIDSAQT